MISPPAAVPPPAVVDPSVNTTTSARRRGLSYLRALSHNRSSGGASPNEPARSPRHYFQRSLSYNDNRPDPATTRRRSISRPNESTNPLSPDLPQAEARSRTPTGTNPQPCRTYPWIKWNKTIPTRWPGTGVQLHARMQAALLRLTFSP